MPKKQKAKQQHWLKNVRMYVFVSIFAFIGVLLLLRSFAATPYLSVEAEAIAPAGGATIVNDTDASGGKAVKFAAANTSPSGQPMPVGDLPGWKQTFTEDFLVDAPIGSWADADGRGVASPDYNAKWIAYGDGWPDTAASQSADPTEYRPSKVVSVKNGVLNKYLHTENGKQMAAALMPRIGNQLYGRYSARIKSDPVNGYKVAWLLWPGSDTWPRDGEIDFPEGALKGHVEAYMHRMNGTSGGDQDAFSTNTTFTDWHTYTIEWTANRINFILDGTTIGSSTSRIPSTPMHWVLQTESCMYDCWDFSASGNLQVDWVAVYTPS